MGSVGIFADHHTTMRPEAVFPQFGKPGTGWLVDANCAAITVGTPMELRLPLAGIRGGDITILGRVGHVTPPHRIDIVHELPWHGVVRLHFDADAQRGTRIRVIAELGDDGLSWLLRHRGVSVVDRVRPGRHGLGLLLSRSGPGSVFTVACGQLASLAVAEVNADGGINGEPLQLIVGDDATDPEIGVSEARRLIRSGCRTILASTTSETFNAVARSLAGTGVLMVHTVMNEGGHSDALCVRLGERPADQLSAAIVPIARDTGSSHWFFAGNDYVWPRVVHQQALRLLDAESSIAGMAYAPLGTRDFSPIIERIQRSGADAILSTFVGTDLVAFERQCHDAGLRSECTTLALALDEPTRERIGGAAAAGMWAASGYFAELPTRLNGDFLQRYRRHAGEAAAPPVSSISEATYAAIHLYADAARRAREPEPHSISRELRATRAEFARGQVHITGPESITQDVYVAQASADGFLVSHAG